MHLVDGGVAPRGARPSRRSRRCRARAPRSRTAARRARRAIASRQRTSSSRCSVFTTQKETSTPPRRLLLSPAGARPRRRSLRPTRRPTTTRCARRWRGPGADVTLVTSALRPRRGAAPRGLRGRASASTARGAGRRARARARRPSSPSTCRTCSRYRARGARGADVVHFQWLTRPAARRAPAAARAPARAHRARRPAARAAARPARARSGALYERVDAVVVHSEHGRARLVDELGVDPAKVDVIPHGAFDAPRRAPTTRRCRRELAGVEGPVVAVLRPAAPVQGHRRAARGVARDRRARSCGSSGMPRMDTAAAARGGAARRALRRALRRRRASSRRCSAAPTSSSLPYREIDQSGVLFTALGASGAPLC